jgi:FAD-dependent urate hydroxylase
MTNRVIQRAIIIGAGIGGPVLAMWLRRIGYEVLAVEARHDAAVEEGAFLGVAPNGMNSLEALGLATLVSAHGAPCDLFRFSNRRGAEIGQIDRSRDREQLGYPLTMIRRGRLQAVLSEEARRRGVGLHYGKRLIAIDRSVPHQVTALFDDGSTESADLLIGCDGLRSTVRRLVLPDAPAPTYSGLLDFGGFATGVDTPVPRGVNEMVFGSKAFFGAFTTPAGETWWFHNGAGRVDARLQPEEARERLIELHRDDPAWIAHVIRATPQILGPWPIHDLIEMPRWSDGNVCLLGDAAHAMSPSAGQGASMAIEDAMVLAKCLRDLENPARAFAAFERMRRPRVIAIYKEARRNSSGKAVGGRWSEWLRDRMLPLFLRLGAASQSRHYAYRFSWDDALANS